MKNADSPATPTLKIEEYKCSEGLEKRRFCWLLPNKATNRQSHWPNKARDVRNACAERYTRMV